MTQFNIDDLQKCNLILKKSLKDWEGCKKDKLYDKKNVSFNEDSRFSTFKISLSLDSYKGYYGSSGCSPLIRIGDTVVFEHYFLLWLRKNIETMLTDISSMMENDIKNRKEEKVKALKAELERWENM